MESGRKTVFSACALCYHSCGTEVTVEDGRVVEVKGQKSHPLNKGKLCPKGRATVEQLYHPERLQYPLKRVDGKFERISWEQAYSEIAEKLNGLKADHGASSLGFFCGSIGVENLEMVSLTHRFQGAFGTPNFFSVESICFRMRVRARQMTFGKYVVEEMDSPLYVLWGHNPNASDFPLAMSIAENMKKGSKVVVIDPRRIALAEKAEMYLAIRPGTDGALALALINVMIEEDLYDHEFVEKWTHGFDRLVPHIKPYTPEWAEKITSVPAGDIRKLARLFASTRGAAIFHGTCTQDQCANGTQTDRAMAILQAISGNINVPGGWVAGPRLKLADITLPIPGKPLGADEYPLFHKFWGRASPFGVMNMVPGAIPDKIKAFIVAGGNPLVTMPDSNALVDAFRRLELLVVYEQFLTETAKEAHYVLPAAHHLEGWGLGYNYNVCHCLPYLMLRAPAVPPLGECRTVYDFYRGLAQACGLGELFPWADDRELIAHELGPNSLSFDYLAQNPEGALYQEKSYGTDRVPFPTPSGKIEIYSDAFEEAGADPLPTYREPEKSPQGTRWAELGAEYPLVLSTGTRLLHYNGSQLHNVKSLIRFEPNPRAEIGPRTAGEFGISHADDVIVETDRGWVRMKADVSDKVMEGVVLVPHGWEGDANCNRLTDHNCREPLMGYPQWKGLLCNIRKAPEA